MKTLITLTLEQLSEQERKDLTYILTDALGEFCRVREPVVTYVLNRYEPYAVQEAKDKMAEVERRVALAKRLKAAAHDMRLTDVAMVVPDLDDVPY